MESVRCGTDDNLLYSYGDLQTVAFLYSSEQFPA